MVIREKIEGLAGKTLKTLERHNLFDVIKVTNDSVIIRPEKSEHGRRISLEVIESAYRQLVSTGEITRVELRRSFSPTNPAYVAAILAVLPGVKHSTNPIHLWMVKEP